MPEPLNPGGGSTPQALEYRFSPKYSTDPALLSFNYSLISGITVLAPSVSIGALPNANGFVESPVGLAISGQPFIDTTGSIASIYVVSGTPGSDYQVFMTINTDQPNQLTTSASIFVMPDNPPVYDDT